MNNIDIEKQQCDSDVLCNFCLSRRGKGEINERNNKDYYILKGKGIALQICFDCLMELQQKAKGELYDAIKDFPPNYASVLNKALDTEAPPLLFPGNPSLGMESDE